MASGTELPWCSYSNSTCSQVATPRLAAFRALARLRLCAWCHGGDEGAVVPSNGGGENNRLRCPLGKKRKHKMQQNARGVLELKNSQREFKQAINLQSILSAI